VPTTKNQPLLALDNSIEIPNVGGRREHQKATVVRPAAYGDAAAKAMRLLANADVELARLRRARRHDR
jgi:hypothetical protein